MLQCPSCSVAVSFSHPDTTILQCICGTVIRRKEGDLLLPKSFYLIPQPDDLLQPGTTGQWKGETFRTLGRVRTWLEGSVFNYWTILFDNGELAWLAEGYGLYGVMRKTTVDQVLTGGFVAGIKPGAKKNLLKGEAFVLEKVSLCIKWEVEGELWLPECNAGFSIYDFVGEKGSAITLIQFLPNYIIPFLVEYVSFASLAIQHTRIREVQGKTFRCTNCEKSITVKTYPFAQSCACRSCGMQYTLGEDGFKKTGRFSWLDIGPDIVIGSRGKVKGIEYELIGFTLKEEQNQYKSRWKEYALYNRQEGYAFLSEYAGHWIYLKEKGTGPVLAKSKARSLVYEGEDFQLYNAYSFSILNAKGEFPYNVFHSGSTQVREFISPPEMWSQEQSRQRGIVWFHGQHVAGSELKNDFEFPAGLPHKEGIGAIEPKFFISPYKLVRTAAIAVAFLLALHLLLSASRQNRVLLDQIYSFAVNDIPNDSINSINIVTPPFRLDKWRSNLELYVHAPVENDWFELNATLVNRATGSEYSIEKGVEYYRGYTDGENWSEGSRSETAYLTKVPAGEYILQLQGVRSTGTGHVPNFHVMVTYDVTTERNFWFCALALLLWPGVQYVRTNNNEKKRWENSPYSPFSYED